MNFIGIVLGVVSIIFVIVDNEPSAEEIKAEANKMMTSKAALWHNGNITVRSVRKIPY